MNTFIKLLIASCVMLSALAGCSPHSDPLQTKTADGTGDSGGGNLYKGKPLESYIKNPQDLDSFKTFVQPMLDTVDHSEVGYIFRGMFLSKVWYFVPGPLNALPSNKIGSSIPTDQVALQDFDSIWIDSNLFDKMMPEDQAKLLVHELLMGAKLLRFDSYKHACLITNTRFPEKETCAEASNTPLGSPSDLTPNDYTIIRKTVAEIFSKNGSMNADDWEELLGEQGFDSPPAIVFENKYNVKTMSLDEIAASVKNSLQDGYKPKFGFDYEHLILQNPNLDKQPPTSDIFWQSHELCDFDFSENGDQYSFRLKMGNGTITSTQKLWVTSNIKLQKRSEFADAPLWNANLWMFDPNAYTGDQPYFLELNFEDSGRLSYIRVRGSKCKNNDCSGAPSPLPVNHLDYVCSMKNQIKFN